MNRALRKIALIGATGALLFSASATAVLANQGDHAEVAGHLPGGQGGEDYNNTEWWEAQTDWVDVDSCEKDNEAKSENFLVLDKSYKLVIVKAGAGEYANTIFENPTAGQTVWADTDGDDTHDDGDQNNISHVIYCDEVEATPTPGGSVGEETDPPTDTAVTSGTTSDSLGLVLMALAGVLAAALVLTPARARRR